MSRSSSSRANRRGELPPSPSRCRRRRWTATPTWTSPGERPAGDEHGEWASDDDVDAEIAAAVAVGVPRLVQVGVDVASSRWSAALAARHPERARRRRAAPERGRGGEGRRTTRWPRSTGSPRCRGCAPWGRPAWTATAPGPRAGPRRRRRSGRTSGSRRTAASRWSSTTATRTRRSCGCSTTRGRRSTPSSTASPATPRSPGRASSAGYVLSFAGTLTFGNAGYLREAAALTPLDQLLVETDAPFLTPDAAPRPAERLPAGAAHRARAGRGDRHGARAAVRALTANAERVFGSWEGPAARPAQAPGTSRHGSRRGTLCAVGRLIAVVLFIAVLVPGVLLARAWALAAGRRAVASAAVEFASPTAEGAPDAAAAGPARPPGAPAGTAARPGRASSAASSSSRRPRSSCGRRPSRSGCSLGVVLAEATRPRPRWRSRSPARRPRRSEQISLWLLWTMRAVVAAEVVTAVLLWRDERAGPARRVGRLGVPLAAWLLAEIALLRALRPAAAGRGRRRAGRRGAAHLDGAPGDAPPASVLALLPLGALLLVAGVRPGRPRHRRVDLLPVALVAGGLLRAGGRHRRGGLPGHLAAARCAPSAGARRLSGAGTAAGSRRVHDAVVTVTSVTGPVLTLRTVTPTHPARPSRTVSARHRVDMSTALVHSVRTVATRTMLVIVS